jgi:hypothetical protein
MNFTHFVGTVIGSDAAMKFLDVVRATLRTTFRSRFELRVPRFFFDLRFVAAKVAADLRRFARTKARENRRLPGIADVCRAGASPASLATRAVALQ